MVKYGNYLVSQNGTRGDQGTFSEYYLRKVFLFVKKNIIIKITYTKTTIVNLYYFYTTVFNNKNYYYYLKNYTVFRIGPIVGHVVTHFLPIRLLKKNDLTKQINSKNIK